MFSKIFQVATFVLVVWLLMQFNQQSNQLSLQTSLLQQQVTPDPEANVLQKDSVEKLTTLDGKVDSLVEHQTKQVNSEKKLQALQAAQNKIGALRKAYTLVLEAEIQRQAQNGKGAAETLKSSKELIWKSGSNYPEHKKALQGLMQDVDITIGAWTAGKLKKDAKPIYSVLKQTLNKQDK
ncbi:MAG: Unknown protein [uncultured Thiotrichaceae bacterium]|uniref:Uncharacterized protein n=1 Tax=uncultured Thiotrichaceae bacterium TaxID=298394 RepID=A0A6S6SDR6_9GAMM|nr:MAG: Unknown protein [uncultured Thiotrichaceae bacterium]